MEQPVPSRRTDDHKEERLLGAYLDAQVYPVLSKKLGVRFERQNSKELQLKGVDVIAFGERGWSRKIDEKGQLHYVNNPIETCAFEINSYQNGHVVDGWLYSKAAITDTYFYITHILLKEGITKIRSAEDFESCKIISIDRPTLKNELLRLGIDNDRIDAIMKNENAKRKVNIQGIEGIYLVRSSGDELNERPINLVIQQKVLLRLSPKKIKHIWPV